MGQSLRYAAVSPSLAVRKPSACPACRPRPQIPCARVLHNHVDLARKINNIALIFSYTTDTLFLDGLLTFLQPKAPLLGCHSRYESEHRDGAHDCFDAHSSILFRVLTSLGFVLVYGDRPYSLPAGDAANVS